MSSQSESANEMSHLVTFGTQALTLPAVWWRHLANGKGRFGMLKWLKISFRPWSIQGPNGMMISNHQYNSNWRWDQEHVIYLSMDQHLGRRDTSLPIYVIIPSFFIFCYSVTDHWNHLLNHHDIAVLLGFVSQDSRQAGELCCKHWLAVQIARCGGSAEDHWVDFKMSWLEQKTIEHMRHLSTEDVDWEGVDGRWWRSAFVFPRQCGMGIAMTTLMQEDELGSWLFYALRFRLSQSVVTCPRFVEWSQKRLVGTESTEDGG